MRTIGVQDQNMLCITQHRNIWIMRYKHQLAMLLDTQNAVYNCFPYKSVVQIILRLINKQRPLTVQKQNR